MAKPEWQGNTYGNRWMHIHLIKMLRHIDVRVLYAFTFVFVIPVCLLTRKSRGITYRYFRERHGYGACKAAWKTYVNHCLFGEVVIDKFAMYAGRNFNVKVEGYEHYLALADKGYVQMSAHIGNYEIAGYTLVARNKPFNVLVYGGEKATVMTNRTKMFKDTNIRMIPVSEDGSHLFILNQALANHEIVSMPADRVVGSPKTIALPFLGKVAQFPLGPFSVATMRDLEVLAVNVMKTSTTGYTIYVTPLSYDKQALRGEKQKQLAESYAACLESMVKKYPEQWYNYFEFWKERN